MSWNKYRIHLKELKSRLRFCIYCFIVIFLINFYESDKLLEFLLRPLREHFQISNTSAAPFKFIFTNLTEGFNIYLKISFFIASLISIPILLIQIFLFVRPGLIGREIFIARIILILSPTLFLISLFFNYYLILPSICSFFLKYSTDSLQFFPEIDKYIDFVIQIFLVFGLSFQLPLVLIFLESIRLISLKNLIEKRKTMFLINFALASILTPPDLLSQFILGMALVVMYELAIIIIKKAKKDDKH